jgi:hypothetical protein
MTKNGQKVNIIVDNYVPCNEDGDPCFASCNGPELWVILLEKAWAKLHGSYHRIDGGYPMNVFRDLTGAPAYSYILKFTEESFDEKTCADF